MCMNDIMIIKFVRKHPLDIFNLCDDSQQAKFIYLHWFLQSKYYDNNNNNTNTNNKYNNNRNNKNNTISLSNVNI